MTFAVESKERLPDWTQDKFERFRMNQLTQILERRFLSIEESLVEIQLTNTGSIGGSEFAPIVHTHGITEITDFPLDNLTVSNANTLLALQGLADVVDDAPANNQVIKYSSSAFGGVGGWVLDDISSAGNSVASLIDTVITAPAQDDVLSYDGTANVWINASLSTLPYLQTTGDTMTGALVMDGANEIRFNTDRTVVENDGVNFTIQNSAFGGSIILGVAGSEIGLRVVNNGSVDLFNNNVEVAATLAAASGGFEVNNTLTGAGFERVITESDLTAVVLDDLADVTLTTPDTGGVLYKSVGDWLDTPAITIDPLTDVALAYNTVEVARTLAAASGGFEVNNTLTGAGFERALTVSDIAGQVLDSRTLDINGTANQIDVDQAGPLDLSADRAWSLTLSDDPVIPGNASITIPAGTTLQEPAGVNGMLRYDSDTGKLRAVEGGVWADVIGGGGGASALDDLTDVTLTTPDTGGVLYKSAGDWLDTPAITIDPLTDVALAYNTVEVARTLAAASGGFEINNTLTGLGFERVLTASDLSLSLDDLSDVTVPAAAGGEILIRPTSGGQWINSDGITVLDTGPVTAKYNGDTRFQTALDGVIVRGNTNNAIGNTQNALLTFATSTGVELGYLGFDNDNGILLQSINHGGEIRIQATDNAGFTRNILNADPDAQTFLYADSDLTLRVNGGAENALVATANGPVTSYHNNIARFQTDVDGVTAFGDDMRLQNSGAGATRIRVNNSEGGYVLLADGDTMQIRQTDNAGVDEDTWMAFANNGGVNTYFNDIVAFGSYSDNNEGLQIGTGSGQLRMRGWDAGDTDIDGLIGGSTFGALIEGPQSGHFTVGIRGNDGSDAFQILDTNDVETGAYVNKVFEVVTGGPTRLYNDRVLVARTETAANGGLEANNTDTGAGFERVLTVSDGIVKGAVVTTTETRTSTTTLTDSTKLAGFGLEPSSEYIIEVIARFDGNGATANGFRWGFDYNGQAANLGVTDGSAYSYQTGGAAESLVTPANPVSQVKTTFDTAGVDEVVEIRIGVTTGGSYVSGTAVDFQFAQGASSGTATRLGVGSYMRVTKVA